MACCMKTRPKKTSPTEPDEMNLLLVGLDGAGKTTLKSVWAKEKGIVVGDTVPTVGYDAAVTQVGACSVTLIDVGGGSQIRPIWSRYFSEVAGVVVVVDASEAETTQGQEAMKKTVEVLHEALNHPQMAGKPMPIFANKMDKTTDPKVALKVVKDLFEPIRHLADQWSPIFPTTALTAKRKEQPDNQSWTGLVWLKDTCGKMWASLGPRIENDVEAQRNKERAEREAIIARIEAEKAEKDASASAGAGADDAIGAEGVTDDDDTSKKNKKKQDSIKSIVQDADDVEENTTTTATTDPAPPVASSVLPDIASGSGTPPPKSRMAHGLAGGVLGSSASLASFASSSSGKSLPPLSTSSTASLPPLSIVSAPPSQVA